MEVLKLFKFLRCRGKITTTEEAKKAYSDCECKKRKKEILEAWANLHLPVLAKIMESGNAKAIFDEIFSSEFPPIHDYGTPEGPIGEYIRENMPRIMSAISTPAEASSLYYIPKRRFCNNGFYCGPILQRWDQLSLIEVDAANTLPAIESALKGAPSNGSSFIKGSIKWLNLCKTVAELVELSKFLFNRDPLKDPVKKLLYQRKVDLLFAEIPKAGDIETIKAYYNFAPDGSAVKLFAFERWLELCSTPLEANEAFSIAPKDAETCRLHAYNRAKDLATTSQS